MLQSTFRQLAPTLQPTANVLTTATYRVRITPTLMRDGLTMFLVRRQARLLRGRIVRMPMLRTPTTFPVHLQARPRRVRTTLMLALTTQLRRATLRKRHHARYRAPRHET